ncbi:MAG: LysE family transporter [Sneathiella sp.]|nr:LysE family transporter [Sneathiella sp.]
MINILNPKLSIFFLAFLPQFIETQGSSAPLEMGLLGLVFMGMTLGVFVIYGMFAAKLRHYVFARPNILKWFNRSVAGAFTGLSIKLALSER